MNGKNTYVWSSWQLPSIAIGCWLPQNSPGAHLERSSIPPRGAQRVCELAAFPYFPDVNFPGQEDSSSSSRSCCYLHLRVAHCSRLGSSFRRFLARKPQLRTKAGTRPPSSWSSSSCSSYSYSSSSCSCLRPIAASGQEFSSAPKLNNQAIFFSEHFPHHLANIYKESQSGSSCRKTLISKKPELYIIMSSYIFGEQPHHILASASI